MIAPTWTNADRDRVHDAETLPLFAKPRMFDGATYDPAKDAARLGTEFAYVVEAMSDGEWWTLSGLRARILRVHGVSCSEAGISARIRDARKPRFGGRTVERRRVEGGGGTYEYRMRSMPSDPARHETVRPNSNRD